MKPYTRDCEIIPVSLRLKQVSDLICEEGLSNREVADRLGLKIKTVKAYLCEIFQIQEVDSRTKLVVKYWRDKYERENHKGNDHHPAKAR